MRSFLPQGQLTLQCLAAIALVQSGALYVAAQKPCCSADYNMMLAVECLHDCSTNARTGVAHWARPFLPNRMAMHQSVA